MPETHIFDTNALGAVYPLPFLIFEDYQWSLPHSLKLKKFRMAAKAAMDEMNARRARSGF